MAITPSYLRKNLYKILDQVAQTGTSAEITLRKGRKLRIIAENTKPDIFSRLTKHPHDIVGDLEDYVHMDWSHYWKPDVS